MKNKVVVVDEDNIEEVDEKNIDIGGYENRMIGFSESRKSFIVELVGGNKILEVPPGKTSFINKQEEENEDD